MSCVIPAAPGWAICTRVRSDSRHFAYGAWTEEPIIAWEIHPSEGCASRIATPITARPMGFRDADCGAHWAIKCPDGCFYAGDNGVFREEYELNEYFNGQVAT